MTQTGKVAGVLAVFTLSYHVRGSTMQLLLWIIMLINSPFYAIYMPFRYFEWFSRTVWPAMTLFVHMGGLSISMAPFETPNQIPRSRVNVS